MEGGVTIAARSSWREFIRLIALMTSMQRIYEYLKSCVLIRFLLLQFYNVFGRLLANKDQSWVFWQHWADTLKSLIISCVNQTTKF